MKFVVFEYAKGYAMRLSPRLAKRLSHTSAVKHEFRYFFEVMDLLKAAKKDIEEGKVFEISAEEGKVGA